MAVGLPVIAADIPVFREVYQEAAAYFDPHSVTELVETIRVLQPSRTALIKAGKNQVKKFSWDKMVEQTIAQYQTILTD
jgi:glycosyltransferase involved in cell wall biosynthesis